MDGDPLFAIVAARDFPGILALSKESDLKFASTLVLASAFGWIEGVLALVKQQSRATPEVLSSALERAVDADEAAIVGALLSRDAIPSCSGSLQRSPLHVALGAGAMRSCLALLDNGADVTLRDDVGRTPADMALSALRRTSAAPESALLRALGGEGGAAVLPLLAAACSSAAEKLEAAGGEAHPSLRDLADHVADMSWPPDVLAAADAFVKAARAEAARGRALALGLPAGAQSASHASSGATMDSAAQLHGASAGAGAGSASSRGLASPGTSARLYPWSNPSRRAAAAALASRRSGSRSRSAEEGDDASGLLAGDADGEHDDDDDGAIRGIMDVDVLLALVVTKFQASVAQGLVASYADIYTALDSLGDDGCSAGDVASGCAAMGVVIAPELLPAIMERMTGREGAVSMSRAEFVSFCELAAAAAAEEDGGAPVADA